MGHHLVKKYKFDKKIGDTRFKYEPFDNSQSKISCHSDFEVLQTSCFHFIVSLNKVKTSFVKQVLR